MYYSLIWDFIKSVGSNIFEGKNLLNVSLPVVLFEPRSFLESLPDLWSFAPQTLAKAAKLKDPIERFKLCAVFALAGLHRTPTQKKPFNPILGETFQAGYADGSKMVLEQTSHHPPISHFQFFGPEESYQLHGWGGWNASFRGNSLKGGNPGPHTLVFPDGQTITWTLPEVWIRGVLWGDRQMEYHGNLEISDKANHLTCKIVFNPDAIGWVASFFYSSKNPIDYFRGDVMLGNMKVCQLDGSWLTHICIDNKKVMEFTSEKAHSPIPIDNPLPTDSRFRRDLNFLKANDLDQAQKAKVEMEDAQRKDAKMRKHGMTSQAASPR